MEAKHGDLQTNAFMAKSLELQVAAEKDYNITLGHKYSKIDILAAKGAHEVTLHRLGGTNVTKARCIAKNCLFAFKSKCSSYLSYT